MKRVLIDFGRLKAINKIRFVSGKNKFMTKEQQIRIYEWICLSIICVFFFKVKSTAADGKYESK